MSENWFPHVDDLSACGSAQDELHARASEAAFNQFGRRAFVRAVVEVSNYCRENCRYCGMRRDNRSLDRYRAELDSLAALVLDHRPESITDINFQAGEDPVAAREIVLPLVKLVRRETNLGVSVCLGTLSPNLTRELQSAGASTYIVKFEMADSGAYGRLEAPGNLAERVSFIRRLAAEGWWVSSGFIAGLPGQDYTSALQNFRLAADLPLDGCSVSPFVPGESTPLARETSGTIDLTLNCMASLRLMRPGWIIPAVSALNLADRASGYRRGLRAGANLCTINITPERHRGDYLLYKRDRFLMDESRVLEALAAEGIEPSSVGLADHYASQGDTPSPNLVAAGGSPNR